MFSAYLGETWRRNNQRVEMSEKLPQATTDINDERTEVLCEAGERALSINYRIV